MGGKIQSHTLWVRILYYEKTGPKMAPKADFQGLHDEYLVLYEGLRVVRPRSTASELGSCRACHPHLDPSWSPVSGCARGSDLLDLP
jgi:hypothetical protein